MPPNVDAEREAEAELGAEEETGTEVETGAETETETETEDEVASSSEKVAETTDELAPAPMDEEKTEAEQPVVVAEPVKPVPAVAPATVEKPQQTQVAPKTLEKSIFERLGADPTFWG